MWRVLTAVMMACLILWPSDTQTAEKVALLDTVTGGSGWPASWDDANGEPCGASNGWDDYSSGWVGLKCAGADGNVQLIDTTPTGLTAADVTGDISG